MELKEIGAVAHVQPALPANYGHWSGAQGVSTWIYDLTAQRWDVTTQGLNAWGAMIARTIFPNVVQTLFQAGFPDFGPVVTELTYPGEANLIARYTYPPGQQLSANRTQNMYVANRWVADHFKCPINFVTSMCSARHFTWHEMEDLRHIILVPWEFHGNVHHSGGIAVINPGGIGAQRIDFSKLESRRFGQALLYQLNGTWLERREVQADGSLRTVQYTYICDDPKAGPTKLQLQAASDLEKQWGSIMGQAWPILQNYVLYMDPPGPKTGWQATPEEVVVYPSEPGDHVEIGILYSFSLDKEHGLGVRLRDGKIRYAGHGDVAL